MSALAGGSLRSTPATLFIVMGLPFVLALAPTHAADDQSFEVVLEKVGTARALAATALREVLEFDEEGSTAILDSLPAVLKTGLSRADAVMLRSQFSAALGKGRSQVIVMVRAVKPAGPDGKLKAAQKTSGEATGAVGRKPAVRRGDPLPTAQAVAELERLKFEVGPAESPNFVTPISLKLVLNDDHLWLASGLPELEYVGGLEAGGVTDTGLSYLGRLKKVARLKFEGQSPGVTDAGLRHLAGFDALHGLSLGSPNITDDGLVHLARYDLSWLSLRTPKITDKGLENLDVRSKSSLWSLKLDGTRVTDEGMKLLADLERLSELSLDGAPITDAGLKHVLKERLECLSIAGTNVTIASLEPMQKLPFLRELRLGGPAVTDEWLTRLPPALDIFELENTKVTGAGLLVLKKKHPKFVYLTLKGNKAITPAGLKQFKEVMPTVAVYER